MQGFLSGPQAGKFHALSVAQMQTLMYQRGNVDKGAAKANQTFGYYRNTAIQWMDIWRSFMYSCFL